MNSSYKVEVVDYVLYVQYKICKKVQMQVNNRTVVVVVVVVAVLVDVDHVILDVSVAVARLGGFQ